MQFFKKSWFIPTLLTIVILMAGGLYIGSLINKKAPIAADDIRSQLESMYGGTVDQIVIEDDVYKVEMNRSGASYSAEIDAATGSVLSLVQTGEIKEEIPQVLSETKLKEIIARKYSGEAERISLNTSGKAPVYEVKLSKDPKFTKVTVDAITGKTISEKVKETTGENALITKENAIAIAQGQLKGEIDDVSYEKTNDGGYYLIEIEAADGREGTFQIHAISGKIISVTWDD
ncbi:PepSY domain-containing protein [Sporosarcina sp. JAI121]|uniref:PepSY domain-containing protein n=1 Tax=Sporosarcina sp. JAI121 TaxID=2723064 RepID=UPI0015CBF234|nr:PepSY domain-containing protein [Sporosarcina sp. JAI121]NYF23317.1 putative membrane protein YkoI [Sporosarcina sp. JAI121]